MKKLLISLVSIFVLYVIYYDLSVGTLSKPTSIVLLGDQQAKQKVGEGNDEEKAEEEGKSSATIPNNEHGLYFKEVKVVGGSTVLSIVEQLQNGPLPVSISQLVIDFEELNPDVKPESIQIGKVYKFPVYPSRDGN